MLLLATSGVTGTYFTATFVKNKYSIIPAKLNIIRFSIIIKDEHNFCSTILEIIDILKSNKIKLNKCKSFIPVGDGFTGVNIICLKMFNNISIPFEIQFHTTKTIKLKKKK